jgi:DNA replication protein DnaC
MTTSPASDACFSCRKKFAWEWIPPVSVSARTLPGTGAWRSSLIDGLCERCRDLREAQGDKDRLRRKLLLLLGGERALREFTLERFQPTAGSQTAFDAAKGFDPDKDNLYVWGPCGVGKSHLANAIVRRYAEDGRLVSIVIPPALTRKIRMKEPEQEQAVIDEFVHSHVFVLDDLGMGNETPFFKQTLQEILDRRIHAGRNGLVVTSKYSLDDLAVKMAEDTIPSRIAGLCQVIHVSGPDRRQSAVRHDEQNSND